MKKRVWGRIEVYKNEQPNEYEVVDELEFVVKKKLIPLIEHMVMEASAEGVVEVDLGEGDPDEPFYFISLEWEDGSYMSMPFGGGERTLQRWRRIKKFIERNQLK